MECHTMCANNTDNKCTRDTAHLIQAKCKDRTILKKKKILKYSKYTL
jgi:hypothetical protein